MTERTIYFIRHGESVSNAGGVTMEHHAIPLSDKGILQAQLVADTLAIKPSQVLTSELIRTQITAQPYCDKHQVNFQINPLLNEIHAVSYELIEGMMGQQRRQIAQQYWSEGDIHKRMGKQADTFTEFRDRVDGFINEMPNLENNTVIFGHGIWFGLLTWKLLGFEVIDNLTMKAFRRFQSGLPLANGIIYRLTCDISGNWRFQVEPTILHALRDS